MRTSYSDLRSGFTLTEVVIASSIMLLVVGIAWSVFLVVTKQQHLVESTNEIALPLQRAVRVVRDSVASAPTAPTVYRDDALPTRAPSTVVNPTGTNPVVAGRTIRLPLAANYYVSVTGGTASVDTTASTWVLGYANTARSIIVSRNSPQAASRPLLRSGATCPSASITTLDLTLFSLQPIRIEPTQLFSVGDTVVLPQTVYGAARALEVESVSNIDAETSRLSFTTQLAPASAWTLPNDVLVTTTSGGGVLFSVIQTDAGDLRRGDLVYYPDENDLTRYRILARSIVPETTSDRSIAIRIDPSQESTAGNVDAFPFVYNTASREMVVNFQCLPSGNPVAGGATTGARARIFLRTNSQNL